ncbi:MULTISPECIES: hypothetical protein [Photorhabdus]|uniref:Uncharacterized protein n=1 Tax=Photorhabdus asymbiotica TaxID=291112 RepID=A0ABX9SLN4_9GAMM|nr:hypothetical protein [Photorhabdus asymbiotica]RKS56824.1 hypothetical protein BDD30_3452 [Photorhabdus asymbiotica]
MAIIYITPNQTVEIYNKGNIFIPFIHNDAIIKNNGPAPVRLINYWAPPSGNYNQYISIDILPGETRTLSAPPNLIYYYKVEAINLSNNEPTEIEFLVLTSDPDWN